MLFRSSEAPLPPAAGTRAERLGRHLHAAGERAEALAPLLEAASAWRRAGGHRECLALLALVEEILEDLGAPPHDPRWQRVVHLRVVSHQRRGEFAEAEPWVRRALELAAVILDAEGRSELLLDAVRFYNDHENRRRARALMDRVRQSLPAGPSPRLALKVAFAEGHLARGEHELDAAEAHLQRARELAESLGDVNAAGAALRDLGVIAWLRDDVPGARSFYGQARDVLLAGGGLRDLAAAINNLGECSRALGEVEEAERYYREAAALLNRAGAAAEAPFPDLNLGMVLLGTGRHREALGPLTRALEEVLRQGNLRFEAVARLLLAPCCAALGDWPGWGRQLDRLDELQDHLGLVEPEIARAMDGAAERALQARRTPEARRGLQLAATLHRILGQAEAEARSRRLLAQLDAPGAS